MRKFLVEREMPGAGSMTAAELRAVAQKSNGILRDLGPEIRWHHSYVTADRICCVYESSGPELIREHARCMGIPADRISEIVAIIDPGTGEG